MDETVPSYQASKAPGRSLAQVLQSKTALVAGLVGAVLGTVVPLTVVNAFVGMVALVCGVLLVMLVIVYPDEKEQAARGSGWKVDLIVVLLVLVMALGVGVMAWQQVSSPQGFELTNEDPAEREASSGDAAKGQALVLLASSSSVESDEGFTRILEVGLVFGRNGLLNSRDSSNTDIQPESIIRNEPSIGPVMEVS